MRTALVIAAVLWLMGTSGLAHATSTSFTGLGTFTTPTLLTGDVTVTGSADISVLQFNGLGIVGGFDDTVVDSFESISFFFASPEAADVEISFSFRNSLLVTDIEGFELGGASLGIVTLGMPFDTPLDVSALFGGVPLESVTLTTTAASFRIGAISFTPIPEPSTGLLFVLGLVGMASVKTRRGAVAR
jgi:hypothetical protein